MILWLASYPKSGNTLVRSLLSSYFFSKAGDFNFELLSNIKQFPKKIFFSKLGVNLNDKKEIAKNYIEAQKIINKSGQFQFWKTHSSFCKMDNKYSFSDLNNTLGVIYIVRDPRNIINSLAHHKDISIQETLKLILENHFIFDSKDEIPVYTGSWSFNYNSWKIFKTYKKYLLVKYEDLVLNKHHTLKTILEFVKRLSKSNFNIDENKIQKVIDATSFDKMQKLEQFSGFNEAKINRHGDKIRFFNLGEKNRWQSSLDDEIRNDIETTCYKEMKELGYLQN